MLHAQPLTVLVVDDELPLREELRLFPWHDSYAELVGEAENGEEALELCRKLRPDVVITDITMPVMDGMDLFRRIKQEFPLTQVVLLTCHSDFIYAKEALKLGALEYLIKVSLLDSELQQVLDKAREAIHREYNHRRNEMDRERWELTRLLSASAKEQEKEKQLGDVSAIFQNWHLNWPMQIARLHMSVGSQEEMFAHRELQTLLCDWELMASGDHYRRWIAVGPAEYVLIQYADSIGEPDCSITGLPGTRLWLQRLQAKLDVQTAYLNEAISLYLVMGPIVQGAAEWLSALELTRLPASALFYDAGGSIYDSAADERIGRRLSHEADFQQLTELMRQAAADKMQLVNFCRGPLSEWLSRVRPEPRALKEWLISNRKVWVNDTKADGQQELIERIHKSRTIVELISLLIREAESRSGSKPKYRKEVARAMQLITEHMAEPITLTWAAERVGLSSFYLSRLFREEVGESFNEFVTRRRIDKAIELLQTTSLKVYEVAEQIGIPSYRYFSVLFRSRTGVSPTEYKKGGAGE